MNDEVRNMCQEILNMDENERLDIGRESLSRMVNGLKGLGLNGEETTNLILNLTKLFVSADARCSEEEYQFFVTVTGINISRDEFFEMTNYGKDADFVNGLVELMRNADPDTRTATVLFGVALMSHNGQLSSDELRLIDSLL